MRSLSILKKAAASILAFTITFIVAIQPVAAAQGSTESYPWSKVTEGTTGDYIADSYDNIQTGHVFESVTQERLLDILSSKGNYYIVFGSPKLTTTQSILSSINEQAKKDGIKKIYHFDPFIDGYQIDITKSDTVFKTANGTSVYELWLKIVDLLQSNQLISGYTSSDTLLFSFSNQRNPKIQASFQLTEGVTFDEKIATESIAKVFREGVSKGKVVPSSVRSDFAFFKRVYNASATYFNYNNGTPDPQGNRTGEAVTEIFTDADEAGFALHQVNFVELINLLNSPGDYFIFFGASWCHNTQAIIGSVSKKAKEYGYDKVYVYDTTIGNQLTFGKGVDSDKVISATSAFNSRNNVNLTTGNGNISYLYGELVKYLGNFTTENSSKKNNSIAFYPNGDLNGTATSTAPWETGNATNAIRLQLPFLIGYNKDKAEPVTKQWLHKNAAGDGTYTEYMLDLAWVIKSPNAVAAAGTIDGLSKVDFASEAVADLDLVFKPDQYEIALSKTGTYKFPSAKVGYSSQKAYGVTIENLGGPTGKLKIELTGSSSKYFKLSTSSIKNIGTNSSATFALKPITKLKAGTYKARVNVTGENNISKSFLVSFTVKK